MGTIKWCIFWNAQQCNAVNNHRDYLKLDRDYVTRNI